MPIQIKLFIFHDPFWKFCTFLLVFKMLLRTYLALKVLLLNQTFIKTLEIITGLYDLINFYLTRKFQTKYFSLSNFFTTLSCYDLQKSEAFDLLRDFFSILRWRIRKFIKLCFFFNFIWYFYFKQLKSYFFAISNYF